MSDVPLGAFISGGLDSSLILYFMSKIKSNIRTFSTGFQDEKYNELKLRQLALSYIVKTIDMNKDILEFLSNNSNRPLVHPRMDRF